MAGRRLGLAAMTGALLACNPTSGWEVLYDEFAYPSPAFDRAKWWRGGLAGVDGTNALLNESDLTSSAMFLGGDFTFTIGGPSGSSRGLFGLGDIDDGDPYIILSDSGNGWRFHARHGAEVHNGPVIASTLKKGDVVTIHWDATGSCVSINGIVKDRQANVHPPRMPLTMLEWNDTGANGRIVMDSVRYSSADAAGPLPPPTAHVASARGRLMSASLLEDTYVDSSAPCSNFNGGVHAIHIRNCRRHPDLTGAGAIADTGQLGLFQFALPPLPDGWTVAGARLSGVVAQNHALYGMPGWAPGRPIELEVLGLDANPDLATVTYESLRDAGGRGVITGYSALGSANFTFGPRARSLDVLRFNTSDAPAGSVIHFPDRQGALCAFVRRRIGRTEPAVITLAIGPGRTQAVSGMECDFKFHARENATGRAPLSLALDLERLP